MRFLAMFGLALKSDLDAALAKIDSLTATQRLPEPDQVPFSVCCHQPWKRDKNHPIEWLTFRHTNGCPRPEVTE